MSLSPPQPQQRLLPLDPFPGFSTCSLDFPLFHINQLYDYQLALVAFHPEASLEHKTEAEVLFWRRKGREKGGRRGRRRRTGRTRGRSEATPTCEGLARGKGAVESADEGRPGPGLSSTDQGRPGSDGSSFIAGPLFRRRRRQSAHHPAVFSCNDCLSNHRTLTSAHKLAQP